MAIKEYERATSSYLLLSIRQRNVVDVFFFLRKMSQPIVTIQFVRKVCSKDFQFSHIAPRDMSSLLKISMNFHTKRYFSDDNDKFDESAHIKGNVL